VARALIIEALRLSVNPENSSFTSIVPFSSAIIHDVLSSIEKLCDTDYETMAPDWLKCITKIADEDCVENYRYFTIANALAYLRGCMGEAYEPIISNQSLVTEFLVLLFLLEGKTYSDIKVDSGNGLEVRCVNDGDSTRNKIFYLNADPSVVSKSDDIKTATGSNQLTLMLGQAGRHIRPSIQRVNNTNQESGTITPKTMMTLGWQHIFNTRPYDGNKDSVAKTIIDAIESPTNYYYENQIGVNSLRRPYLKETE
jgi:hypothetical protein